MKNLYDYLQHAKRHPSMYVRDWSLSELELMCHGYNVAPKAHGVEEFGSEFNERFCDWLSQRFGWSGNLGWAWVIGNQSETPEAAFWRFYELLEQFYTDNALS